MASALISRSYSFAL